MEKPQAQPDTEWLCPDEMELILEAIHAFKTTNDGKRHSGRLAWIRSKLVRAKLDGAAIRCYNSWSLERKHKKTPDKPGSFYC